MRIGEIDVLPGKVVPEDTVLSLHAHPLQFIDTQRRSDAMDIFGLSRSFVCHACRQVRHRFVRYCSSCSLAFCHSCYQGALSDQTEAIQEIMASHSRAESEKQRAIVASVHRNGTHAKDLKALSPIMQGCITGDFELVKEMVEKNEFSGTLDLEHPCETGHHASKTILFLAAEFGHRPIVMLLLARGAKVNAFDNRGVTPLMIAAFGGFVEVLNELLFAGADFNQRALCGYTPLLFAASAGHDACITRLVASGASIAARTPQGRTALIVAALNGHKATVEVLLNGMQNDDIISYDFESYTALDAAIAAGHAHVEQVLRRHPAFHRVNGGS